VAIALALDFMVTAPALVFFLLVRSRRASWRVLLPTLVAGYVLATLTMPARHQSALAVLRLLAVPGEIALFVWVVVLARRMLKGGVAADADFATRVRTVARRAFWNRLLADVVATEIALVWHAFRWRRPAADRGACWTVHREVDYLSVLIALIMLVVAESVTVHVLLSRWSMTATWIFTGLSVWGLIWLVGDYRAMTARPVRLTARHLRVRLGLRWEADVPLDRIASVDVPGRPAEPGATALVASLMQKADLRLRLTAPVEIVGMYGRSRTVDEIWLRVDRAAQLCEAVRARMASR
jgi:hypothetical protein